MRLRLRRKRLPEELEAPYAAFEALIPELERAKAALTEAVPGSRLPGRPLADTLHEFEVGLREIRSGMDGWRAPEMEDAWLAASVVAEVENSTAAATPIIHRSDMCLSFDS